MGDQSSKPAANSRRREPSLSLSVVIATTDSWPATRACLTALLPQVAALGAELVLADGTGRALPEEEGPRHPELVRLRKPGASVFELRAAGVAASRGQIIALTEDHCVAAPDWCRRIIEAHRRHADALAVGGGVANGSTDSIVDWANYLLTFSTFLPPIDGHRRDRCPTASNASYKRAVLFPPDVSADGPRAGWIEFELNPTLHARGQFLVDDAILVHHVQSYGFLEFLATHFHNGRSTAGLAALRPWKERRALLRSRFRQPRRLLATTLRVVKSQPELHPKARRSIPLVAALACCHTAGEIAGLVFGAGRSPERLH
jgi:hypothetical protein